MNKSKKRIQQKNERKKDRSKIQKKTWAQVGPVDKELNRNFDETEGTWPHVETLVSEAIANINPVHPGEILKEDFLKPLKLTVEKAAKKIGINKGDLSAILRKKTNISFGTAIKLAKAFKTTSNYWINMKEHYVLIFLTLLCYKPQRS